MRRAYVPSILLLAFLAPIAAGLTIERPGFHVGDAWSYEVTVTDGGALIEQGDRRFVVVARGPVQYHGTTRDGATVTQHENTTFAGETHARTSTAVYDPATGAFLFTRSGAYEIMTSTPCVEIEYPVDLGDRWTATCQANDITTETFYQAVGGERLVVPAGPYDTIAVDKVGDLTGRVWLAAETCGRPVAEYYQVNDRATFVNLTSVSCRPSDGAPVPPPTPTTSPGATPTGSPATPTSAPTPTPGASPSSAATPTTTPTRGPTESPGAATWAILAIVGVAAFALRRKRS